ncbi:MAG: leucyl aminopeptidase family protein, partial [Oscillospiraceae bacterium]|nr:leucyl aminopeptidase family protein [Oscillospiraceae bacterium]
MKPYQNEPVQAEVHIVDAAYLKTRCLSEEDGRCVISIGRGEQAWTPLACKEVYGKAVKTALEQEYESCLFDLTPAAGLGQAGINAAAEGIYGGAYRKKFAMNGQWEPKMACWAGGTGWDPEQLRIACELARSVIEARNMVNRPANLFTSEDMARTIADMAKELPVEVRIYSRDELAQHGLNALLSVGDSSGYAPSLTVMRYTGAPESKERLGYVGKGVTIDTGGYSLKSRTSMENMKGDMAGGAAAAEAVRALAAAGAKVNVTAVIPICENRISPASNVPGDVVCSYAGKTIEVLSTDAEGRLMLADSLTWAVRQEGCTKLVDIATLTGSIHAMLGSVAAGVMSNDSDWYAKLEEASALSGERYWRIPDFPEYEKLIESDLADLRNTSKDGCGAITAGLFLRHFVEDVPWMHIDIAGSELIRTPVWQHQVPGATGMGVTTHVSYKHL